MLKIENKFIFIIFLESFFVKVKHTFVGESVKDEKVDEHREQFTALVRELKNVFRHDGLAVTITVLPNVNSTGTQVNV